MSPSSTNKETSLSFVVAGQPLGYYSSWPPPLPEKERRRYEDKESMNKEENERENSQIIQLLVRKKRNSEE